MLSKKQRFLLSISSSILLCLPWYEGFSGLFIFVAFVPLLIVEDFYYRNKQAYTSSGLYGYAALSFLLWNASTSWWIFNASLFGAIMATLVNTFLFTTVFWLFHLSKRVIGEKLGNLCLVIYWVGFEYFYLNAEISWTWLNLGNGLANSVKFIQWYEYTGVLGGTLWILVINLLITTSIIQYINLKYAKSLWNKWMVIAGVIIVPIAFSLIQYFRYSEKQNPCKIVVLQPNIDPYTDKFGGMSPEQQLDILLHIADSAGNKEVDYFVGPETAIQEHIWESEIDNNWTIFKIRSFLQKYPKAKFVTGGETVKEYLPGEKLSATARKFSNANVYYDSYNTALQIDSTLTIQIYHKSQLVVGVEKMPYIKYLRFLEKYALKLGGTFGSLGIQEDREIFRSANDSIQIAPVICYESIYGEYLNGYIKNGANFIFVITNDGWWGNTPGQKQHLSYSRLRAIETRRSVARSANTGTSAFINQRGDLIQTLGWWKRGALTETLNSNNYLTFYVKHGDYLGRFAQFASLLAVIYILFLKIRKRGVKQ